LAKEQGGNRLLEKKNRMEKRRASKKTTVSAGAGETLNPTELGEICVSKKKRKKTSLCLKTRVRRGWARGYKGFH